ncbi:MAG: OmpA family protein [Bdellovibrio sp.]|nr:OmpA family protein [Bdellovibrio sp.]
MADKAPPAPECPKCPPCKPGLPSWLGTMADMMTNTLTFFVLLLSFAKTETSKQEAALGSIRNAFGGLSYKMGETVQLGKTADNDPAMLEAEDPARPFPIDFLTTEGLLDKYEMNRESTEILRNMRKDLATVGLAEQVDVYETSEGIKVHLKEAIVFKQGSVEIEQIAIESFEKLVKLLGERDWVVFVCGHASPGEKAGDGVGDATMLSAIRANVVMKSLIRRGVPATSITPTFYGDSKPISSSGKSREENIRLSRRVEFMLRKTDLYQEGRKVGGQK